MNRFAIILLIATACCAYVASAERDLIKELDAHVQTLESGSTIDTVKLALDWIKGQEDVKHYNTRSAGPKLFKEQVVKSLITVQKVLEKEITDCNKETLGEYNNVDNDILDEINKEGKLHVALIEYVRVQYNNCKEDFKTSVQLGDEGNFETLIKLVTETEPKRCETLDRDEFWAHRCIKRIEEIEDTIISKSLLTMIENFEEIAQLSGNKKEEALKEQVAQLFTEQCDDWLHTTLTQYGHLRVIGVLDLWENMLVLLGEKRDATVTKYEGYVEICQNVKVYIPEMAEIVSGAQV